MKIRNGLNNVKRFIDKLQMKLNNTYNIKENHTEIIQCFTTTIINGMYNIEEFLKWTNNQFEGYMKKKIE